MCLNSNLVFCPPPPHRMLCALSSRCSSLSSQPRRSKRKLAFSRKRESRDLESTVEFSCCVPKRTESNTMNPVNDFKSFRCKPCEYFQNGLCFCVRRKDGPRATRDCRTCRCQIVNFLLCQKQRTHKIFYHLRNNGLCECKLVCRLSKNGKQCQKKVNGKVTFKMHKTCQPYYTQCRQMRVIEKNYNELCLLYTKFGGKLEIPSKCTPFLGTKRRNFQELKTFEKECFTKRASMAMEIKSRLKWKKPSKLKYKEDNIAFKLMIEKATQETEIDSETTRLLPKRANPIKRGGHESSSGDGSVKTGSRAATVRKLVEETQEDILSTSADLFGSASDKAHTENVTTPRLLEASTQTTHDAEFAGSISTVIQYYDMLNRNRQGEVSI